MEKRNYKKRSLQYLPTAIKWSIYEDIAFAAEESQKMADQYYEFSSMRFSAILEHENHFKKELGIARKQMMDSGSFLVSLRRRGFKLALLDMGIERTVIDEDYPKKEVAVVQQLDFFPSRSIERIVEPDSKWSTAVSR